MTTAIVIFGAIFWLCVIVWLGQFIVEATQHIVWRRRQGRRNASSAD